MGLDVKELMDGWDCPDGEVGARLIVGRDGPEVVQLRIELGVLQMSLEGRPDGLRYHGMTNALEYIEHELKHGTSQVSAEAWAELEREFSQYNYRRVALSNLVDTAVANANGADVRPYLIRALSDVDICARNLALLDQHCGGAGEHEQHRPTLAFNKARLTAQLRIVDEQFDEAVEEVSRGRQCLDTLLTELGLELEDREQDPLEGRPNLPLPPGRAGLQEGARRRATQSPRGAPDRHPETPDTSTLCRCRPASRGRSALREVEALASLP